MTARNLKPASPPKRESGPGVNALARKALAVLAARRASRPPLSETFLSEMRATIASPDKSRRWDLIHRMEEAGISRDDICDLYVPQVARRMGDDWCNDEMSFADVSIGAARLQAMVRDLVPEKDDRTESDGRDISVLVLANEYHTLGAMVLTGQMRRVGVSVRLMLGRPASEVVETVRAGRFDGVMMSVAESDDLTPVRDLVERLSAVLPAQVPLIVGGAILGAGPETVTRLTGAAHATNDLTIALSMCCQTDDRGTAP